MARERPSDLALTGEIKAALIDFDSHSKARNFNSGVIGGERILHFLSEPLLDGLAGAPT
jgi:hypothetical protein